MLKQIYFCIRVWKYHIRTDLRCHKILSSGGFYDFTMSFFITLQYIEKTLFLQRSQVSKISIVLDIYNCTINFLIRGYGTLQFRICDVKTAGNVGVGQYRSILNGLCEKVHLYLTSWKSDIDRLSILIPDLSISSLNSNFLENMVSRSFFSQNWERMQIRYMFSVRGIYNLFLLRVYITCFLLRAYLVGKSGPDNSIFAPIPSVKKTLSEYGCSDMWYKNKFIFDLSLMTFFSYHNG